MIDYAKCKYSEKFYFYTHDNIIGLSIRMYGEYTEQEVQLLKHFLDRETSVVYDIGGNIGYHTLAFSLHSKTVHSFEPNNDNYTLLVRNTVHRKNVINHNVAVSDTDGRGFINTFNKNTSGNYGECKLSNEGQDTELVKIDSLDIEKPDLIKIDVEGHEYQVFCGMINTIKKHKPVIFYENLHGDKFPEIYDMLTELNYKIYYVPVSNYNIENYNNNPFNIFGNGGVLNNLAVQSDIEITGLHQMIDRDDTFEKLIKRLNK